MRRRPAGGRGPFPSAGASPRPARALGAARAAAGPRGWALRRGAAGRCGELRGAARGEAGPLGGPEWPRVVPEWPQVAPGGRGPGSLSGWVSLRQALAAPPPLQCRVFGASTTRRHWAVKTSVNAKPRCLSGVRERFWKQPGCPGRWHKSVWCGVSRLILYRAAPGWCNHMLYRPDRFANVTHEAINVTLRTTLAATTKLVVPTPAKPILPVQTGVQAQQEEQSSGMTIFFSLLVLGE